jgi:hypothetical protein
MPSLKSYPRTKAQGVTDDIPLQSAQRPRSLNPLESWAEEPRSPSPAHHGASRSARLSTEQDSLSTLPDTWPTPQGHSNEVLSQHRSRSFTSQLSTYLVPGHDALPHRRSLKRLVAHLVYPLSVVRGVMFSEEQRT